MRLLLRPAASQAVDESSTIRSRSVGVVLSPPTLTGTVGGRYRWWWLRSGTSGTRGPRRAIDPDTVDRVTVYWVNTFRSVSDPDKLAAYVELAGPVMRESGGRFLARGMPTRAFESGVVERTVIIEFDSTEQAVAAYESPGYQAALAALGDGAQRDLRIIEAEAAEGSERHS